MTRPNQQLASKLRETFAPNATGRVVLQSVIPLIQEAIEVLEKVPTWHVKLTYFKSSGKYYSSGEYTSHKHELFEVWEEVAQMQKERRLPGLVEGAGMPLISVKVCRHPHGHPHLIVNMEVET